MKKIGLIILGLVLMGGGLFGATLKVDTTWHYFGNGIVCGIGLSILLVQLFFKRNR